MMVNEDLTRGRDLGDVFAHTGVATAYEHRPPYPVEVFDILERLIVDEPRVVLDIGAGEGAVARPLAARVDRLDAVDVSAAMIEVGRQRPGGRRPTLRWIESAVETAPLNGPYALITAGASLHWMRWRETMERLVPVMSANAQLAVIEHGPRALPWWDELLRVIKRHSRNPEYNPGFSVTEKLRREGLFEVAGSAQCGPVQFRQPIDDYVEQFHSTSSLAREHMTRREAQAFDDAIKDLVQPWASEGVLELPIHADLIWGRPQRQG
jgi:ubiquinone/menaquinone biosynthesis C-methylase UbiE